MPQSDILANKASTKTLVLLILHVIVEGMKEYFEVVSSVINSLRINSVLILQPCATGYCLHICQNMCIMPLNGIMKTLNHINDKFKSVVNKLIVQRFVLTVLF